MVTSSSSGTIGFCWGFLIRTRSKVWFQSMLFPVPRFFFLPGRAWLKLLKKSGNDYSQELLSILFSENGWKKMYWKRQPLRPKQAVVKTIRWDRKRSFREWREWKQLSQVAIPCIENEGLLINLATKNTWIVLRRRNEIVENH